MIAAVVEWVLEQLAADTNITPVTLETILDADAQARSVASEWIARCGPEVIE